ncbi:MAG: succinate dehydrogenase, cytochrome b556 subunit [Rickettsiales bacterium]
MPSTTEIHSQRPLSPHLQVYKPEISSSLSIFHRITGLALAFGSLILAVWLWTLAYGGPFSEGIYNFFGSTFGQICLIGWSAALYYHLGNGIRHLFWDAGYGFEVQTMIKTGYAVLLFTLLTTTGTWLYVYGVFTL